MEQGEQKAADPLQGLPQPEGTWPPNLSEKPFKGRQIRSVLVVDDDWLPKKTRGSERPRATVKRAFPDIPVVPITARELEGRLVERDRSLDSFKDSLVIFAGWRLFDGQRKEWVLASELSKSLQGFIGRVPVAICLPIGSRPEDEWIKGRLREGGAVGSWEFPTIPFASKIRSEFDALVQKQGLVIVSKSEQPTAPAVQ